MIKLEPQPQQLQDPQAPRQYQYGEVLLKQREQIAPSAKLVETSLDEIIDISEYGDPLTLTNSSFWSVGSVKFVKVGQGALLDSRICIEAGIYRIAYDSHYNVLQHGLRVANNAVRIANELGYKQNELDDLALAAKVHDLSISTLGNLLRKPADFNEEELKILKNHPAASVAMMKKLTIDQVHDGARVMKCILQHHEHFDGSGYPYGLAGMQISLDARIVYIADAYDAMRSWRPHRLPLKVGKDGITTERRLQRSPLSPAQAMDELRAHAGKRFDSNLVAIFASINSELAI